jgi:transcriptional regulator with XRE-family HTH domain
MYFCTLLGFHELVKEIDPDSFCKNFKRLRIEQGYTQETLAEKINSTHATINRWESGKNKPNYLDFYKLMAALDVTFEELSGLNALPEKHIPTPEEIIAAAIADAIEAGGYQIMKKEEMN